MAEQITTEQKQNIVDQDQNILLQIKGLRTYFHLAEGIVRAVDGVDLTIHKNETLGIVGESGCGKSISAFSTLRLIYPPGKIEGGDIFYHKVPKSGISTQEEIINLAKLDPNGDEIRNIRGNYISMVFQEPMTAMSPVRTVGLQIMEALMLHHDLSKDEARAQTIEMLRRVRMANPERVVDDYPFQLSGGMRQRAVIAMALICRPNLLIADEPTTALDVTTEAQILNLMRDLQAEFNMSIPIYHPQPGCDCRDGR
jgi:ABC-type dipeptide/oligopeptide/nickel transport system ATPase component